MSVCIAHVKSLSLTACLKSAVEYVFEAFITTLFEIREDCNLFQERTIFEKLSLWWPSAGSGRENLRCAL